MLFFFFWRGMVLAACKKIVLRFIHVTAYINNTLLSMVSSIPAGGYTTVCLSVHLLVNISIVSRFRAAFFLNQPGWQSLGNTQRSVLLALTPPDLSWGGVGGSRNHPTEHGNGCGGDRHGIFTHTPPLHLSLLPTASIPAVPQITVAPNLSQKGR